MLFKKIISGMFLLLAIVVFSSSSFAQNWPGDKAGRSADMLYKKLNLTTDQYNKVYSSFLDYYTKQASKPDMKNWDAVKSSMSSVLNKDQMAMYSSMNEKSIMNPVMRSRHKMTAKTTDSSTKEMTKDNTKKPDDMKKDATKKMEDTKKDMNKKTDDAKKDVKKK